jgi:D-psicose/D-tagatose/L-ribulose 3-epimerase
MKITISNIAWETNEDFRILSLLKKYEIRGIEVAPTKIWSDPTNESPEVIKEYKKYWKKNGIEISSLQSILFGHPEMNIFTTQQSRQQMLRYIEKMIQVSAFLGAKIMVFGSPKNRDRKGMKIDEALEISAEFFYKIGEKAKLHGIFFCIEPNPRQYGTDFVNNTNEAIEVIKLVNHPYFRLHLDSGALTVNQEDYEEAITQGFQLMKHFHISERNLLPIGTTEVDHAKIAAILRKLHYKRWVSIEMLPGNSMQYADQVEAALKMVKTAYA